MARWMATDVAHTTDDTQHRQTGGVDAPLEMTHVEKHKSQFT